MPKWALLAGAAVVAYLLLRPRSAGTVARPPPASGTGAQIGNVVDGIVKLFQ